MKTSLLARWFVTILMGVALTTGLTGCIGSDDIPTIPGIGGGDDVPAALLGNWTFQSVTLDGQAQDLSDWFEWNAETVEAHLIVADNFTLRSEEVDGDSAVLYWDSGTFTVDGQTITVTITSENGNAVTAYTAFDGSWLVVSNLLTLTMIDDGHTVAMVLTR